MIHTYLKLCTICVRSVYRYYLLSKERRALWYFHHQFLPTFAHDVISFVKKLSFLFQSSITRRTRVWITMRNSKATIFREKPRLQIEGQLVESSSSRNCSHCSFACATMFPMFSMSTGSFAQGSANGESLKSSEFLWLNSMNFGMLDASWETKIKFINPLIRNDWSTTHLVCHRLFFSVFFTIQLWQTDHLTYGQSSDGDANLHFRDA